MTVVQALCLAREAMLQHNIPESRIESELLLRYALRMTPAGLYLNFERELNPEEQQIYGDLVRRRLAGEPTAYITGHREFYGLDFYVDRRVLIPRPETETLVAAAVKAAGDRVLCFADIGTGSGAVAVSLAVNLLRSRIFAVDISADALAVAAVNCRKHHVERQITLLQGNLLEPVASKIDIVTANLPYVCQTDLVTVNTRGYEPELALDGGTDGLDIIRQLIPRAVEKLNPGGTLLLEIGQGQADDVIALFQKTSPRGEINIFPDLAGIPRVVTLSLS